MAITYVPLSNLESERLIFRKVTLADAESYFRNLSSREEVSRGMLWDPHETLAQSVASMEKALCRYEGGRSYHWGVCLKGSDDLIGIIDLLRFEDYDCSCSFAYMLAPSLWGKGLGSEMLKTVFRFAFTRMGVEVIRADHFEDNPASGGAMRKAGMVCTGSEPGKYVKNGISHNAVLYEIRPEVFLK